MLKIDGHAYSPTILHRIVLMGGKAESSDSAAQALQVVGEVTVSSRTVTKLVSQIGQEMQADRDRRTQEYVEQDLPRQATRVAPRQFLAAIFFDGGRMRTRTEGGGHGVHDPHWRETKNAAFHRMTQQSLAVDPQPELPECFRNQAYVEKMVLGLKKARQQPSELAAAAETAPPQEPAPELPQARQAWQPKPLFRTCLSSLSSSQEFGPMMAAEADARGFYAAEKRAFVGDGEAYNWTVQKQWFPTFTPVADFVHVVEHLYEAAKALDADVTARWSRYVAWASACWKGEVARVIEESDRLIGEAPPQPTPEASAVLKIVRSTRTYLNNNQTRMKYADYRRDGLPVTSSMAESLVKQVSKRVKGTEKFWNDGASGEAILQVRAAILSDDDRLAKWIENRPVTPYASCCRKPPLALAA